MPLIESKYQPPAYLPGGDLQTIAPALLRKVFGVQYRRERIVTHDKDFIDLDWLDRPASPVALVIHGLEASAATPYMKGMSKALHAAGFSVAAMNLRGCSGSNNAQMRSYHSGSTDDVDTVIQHILQQVQPAALALVGFSLGGNLVLKYLGERKVIDERIRSAVALSVPCDLAACAVHLDIRLSWLYRNRFLRTLKKKALTRAGRLPFAISKKEINGISTLVAFDDVYTSQLYGFAGAADYYARCSSKQFIPFIKIPSLILTALNDPFFTEACFPVNECRQSEHVFLETPAGGGHVGFCSNLFTGNYYSEARTIAFFANYFQDAFAPVAAVIE